MKKIVYKASERGHQHHGWLDTHHTFSFAGYYDPTRVHFGALRVVNDDIVEGGMGFSTHPHDNMEIISIPLSGNLQHRDSMGHTHIIRPGDVQVMSAGTGITHSEYNANRDQLLNFLQIWIFPKLQDVTPRYDQKSFDYLSQRNKLTEIVTPIQDNGNLWISQDAWLHIGLFDKDAVVDYTLHDENNGVFAMVIGGKFDVNGEKLETRDGVGIWETDSLHIISRSADSWILLIEVPMTV